MQRGFTFIELIIVIAIISIVAAMAVPALGNSLARQDLDNTARELAADLRWLQQLSINSAGGLTPSLNYFRAPSPSYRIKIDGQYIKTVVFPPTVTLGVEEPFVMQFKVDGTPTDQSQNVLTVTLRSIKAGVGSRQVIVQAATGRVRVESR